MNRSDFKSALRRNQNLQSELSSLDGDVQTQEDAEEQLDHIESEISALEDKLSQLRRERDTIEKLAKALPAEDDLDGEDVQGLLSRLEDEERRIKNYISDHFGDEGDADA